MLFAPKDLDVTLTHILSVSLESKVDLQRGSEDTASLSRESTLFVDEQDIDDIQSGKERVDITLGTVERQASKANNRERCGGSEEAGGRIHGTIEKAGIGRRNGRQGAEIG